MSEQSPNMVALMEHAAKALVENQAEVLVDSFDEDGEIVLELTVAEDAWAGSLADRAERHALCGIC